MLDKIENIFSKNHKIRIDYLNENQAKILII